MRGERCMAIDAGSEAELWSNAGQGPEASTLMVRGLQCAVDDGSAAPRCTRPYGGELCSGPRRFGPGPGMPPSIGGGMMACQPSSVSAAGMGEYRSIAPAGRGERREDAARTGRGRRYREWPSQGATSSRGKGGNPSPDGGADIVRAVRITQPGEAPPSPPRTCTARCSTSLSAAPSALLGPADPGATPARPRHAHGRTVAIGNARRFPGTRGRNATPMRPWTNSSGIPR